jgi:uncharacterized membrane protein YphA (DoxX/SURF4 family)
MRILFHLSRVLLGVTFIFSGFVKGIDPWGSAYKFTDYFNVMGLDWLLWAAFPLGVFMAFTEFIIGVAFLLNWRLRFFSWLGLLFMAFFLPFTLWIALKNPVTDCGCFGDALVISNWETFYKNIFLFAIAMVVFKSRNKREREPKTNLPVIFSGLSALVYVLIVFYSFNHLPIIDFRPYKIGVNIPEAMSVPDGAPKELYKNVFYYKNKNSGEVKEFTDDNYPWKDTVNWEYESMESFLVQEGYEPPIHDLQIEGPDGENLIDFFIYDENYVFILVAKNLHESNTKSQKKINELAEWAIDNEISFIGLTSTAPDEAAAFAEENNIRYEFFNCDEITLKTMIRSNPGLIVIKNGTILGKWHYNDIPTPDEFQEEFME